MSKERARPLGEHVRFTKYDYRPFVDPIHLVNSDRFQKIVKAAANKRRQEIAENVKQRK